MQEKLARLEDQLKRLLTDFTGVCKENEDLRRENENLLHELMEKSRRLEVSEERDTVLMEAQAERKRLEEQHRNIRKEAERLLEKIRALRTAGRQ